MAGSSICCAPCCGASLRKKTQSRGSGDVAPTVFRHLVEELKRLERPSDDAAAASNKRTFGENSAACKMSRVMFSVTRRFVLNSSCLFSAACSMRVTFADQFRVVGKIRRAMSLKALNLWRELVWHSDAVAASLWQVGQMRANGFSAARYQHAHGTTVSQDNEFRLTLDGSAACI
jgi:hypothetical protein